MSHDQFLSLTTWMIVGFLGGRTLFKLHALLDALAAYLRRRA